MELIPIMEDRAVSSTD